MADKDDDAANEATATNEGKNTSKEPGGMVPRRTLIAGIGGGVIAGAAAGFAGGFYFPKPGKKPRPPQDPAFIPISSHSARKGANPAKVTIVKLTDFQCPFCDRCRKTVDEILAEHPDDVGLVLMHKPLAFHEQADEAAAAFQAALRQDKAWELYPILFEHRKELFEKDLLGYAAQAGLDVDKFKADMKSPEVLAEVAEDQKLADTFKVVSTPTTFVNGIGIRGAQKKDKFDKVVADEIAAADKLLAEGVPLAEIYEKRCKANVEAKVIVA